MRGGPAAPSFSFPQESAGGTHAVFPLHLHSPGSGPRSLAARQGVKFLLLGFFPSAMQKPQTMQKYPWKAQIIEIESYTAALANIPIEM